MYLICIEAMKSGQRLSYYEAFFTALQTEPGTRMQDLKQQGTHNGTKIARAGF